MEVTNIIAVAVFVLSLMMLYRIFKVSMYRKDLIDTAFKLSSKRIDEGREDWRSPWNEYEALPSYEEMVWQFWRPLDSFLTDGFKKELAK